MLTLAAQNTESYCLLDAPQPLNEVLIRHLTLHSGAQRSHNLTKSLKIPSDLQVWDPSRSVCSAHRQGVPCIGAPIVDEDGSLKAT